MKQLFLHRLLASIALCAAFTSPFMAHAQTRPAAADKMANDVDDAARQLKADTFKVEAEAFADLQTLRYQVPGFAELTLQQKQLAYYLYEAALCGRDIIYDQKSKYGLTLRKTLEAMYGSYTGEKSGPDWQAFKTYCGRFWFSNGNHHHYGNEKFLPDCPPEYFEQVLRASDAGKLPLQRKETVDAFWKRIQPIVYDTLIEPKLVDQRSGIDNVVASSNNFYENVTQKEVEAFYAKFDTKGNAPSWGLNSKTVKEGNEVKERVWKSGGMYGAAIDAIIGWLEKAEKVAENPAQEKALRLLVDFYRTGDLKTFDDYSIAWVDDVNSRIDVVNGFIEVYLDAIGKKASFESCVSLRDEEATKRIAAIAANAQWFEDHSPIMAQHKKKEVKGITAKAITVIVESGDAAPSTPIGINLPNADWIRKEHGSKSVSLSNVIYSYNQASQKGGFLEEFAASKEVYFRLKKWGALASDLHTDMHECIGHASGQINPGVETTDKTLKNYASTLEEARADLVGLYFIMDQKLVDIGVMPTMDVAKAEYDSYMMNGMMTQLVRLKPGDQIEEAHMRNRAVNAWWVYYRGKKANVVEIVDRNGKQYIQVNDYARLRELFGELLREIQRIKSEGDFAAGQKLVEGYGVKPNLEMHVRARGRYDRLHIKPYRGFIQPKLTPVMDGKKMVDVKVEYPMSFFDQMMEYGEKYALLPATN